MASLAAAGFFAAALASPALAASTVTLKGHIPGMLRKSASLGVYTASSSQTVTLTLPLRNKVALEALLTSLYDPSDAQYGHFLTPAEFTAKFGPTQGNYDAVIAFAQSKGLKVEQTWSDRTQVDVSGTVSQLNAAFDVTLKQFRAPDGRVFHAPDTEVIVPSTLSGKLSGVVGLDNAIVAKPNFVLKGAAAPSGDVHPDSGPAPEQGTGPGGGFGPSDLRKAYGLSTTSLNGTGQTIAMVEYGSAFNPKDVLKYEAAFGLPRTPLSVVSVGTKLTNFAGASTETILDIDMQIAMAPNAKQILVYQGRGNTNNSLTNTIKQVQTDNIAQQVSISYGFGIEASTTPSTFQNTLNTIFTAMVAQGQSVYISSGDDGSDSRATGATTVDQLGAQPMICCVGGTQLFVQKPQVDETYKMESTWNADATTPGSVGTPADGAGGGGVSISYAIPSYQVNAANAASAISGSNVSKTKRNIPDISAVADPSTGVAIYSSVDPTLPGARWYIFGGTSAAAPLWAGFNALINQNRQTNQVGTAIGGQYRLGFPNASLYPLAYTSTGLTSSYNSIFHDINDLSSNLTVSGGTNYSAVTGFDDSTGLGSFNGTNLIFSLSGAVPSVTGGGGHGNG